MRAVGLAIFTVASMFVGCVSEHGVVRQGQVDLFQQEPTDKVDVLWVIDNSLSMFVSKMRSPITLETLSSTSKIGGLIFISEW